MIETLLPMTRVMLWDDEGVAIYEPSVHITAYELAQLLQLFMVAQSPGSSQYRERRDWRSWVKEKGLGRNFIFKTKQQHDQDIRESI